MQDLSVVIDAAIGELTRAKNQTRKSKTKQVSGAAERDYLRSVSYAWFKSHREVIKDFVELNKLMLVDEPYQQLLELSAKSAARSSYDRQLRMGIRALEKLRLEVLLSNGGAKPASDIHSQAPDFARLVGDIQMRAILTERWNECVRCLQSEAYFAATVMMGGLLEALFVARATGL